ncbi:insulinase family protein [Sandaracinobacter neustonicus]|uniref:Insulinase family protein n=1 Tax=Sandaracinobacter neustonicus TaxID=1715348 RepID=A0A501XDB2_9SPHN|nr:pitrilysin family protein [Sandaracinobacter neustonicus]TPE58466.1 insulinase family protein [Sandaracinobacter neustonicus]
MMKKLILAALLAATPLSAVPAVAATAIAAQQNPAPLSALVAKVDIPYEQFTLANGLRVIVHTDRKAPIVSVNVWYHVGSVDEPKGRSGFAHLFEHIMFRGSEHSRVDHFKPLEEAGGSQFNGTTDFNRTNYFQTVPTPALDLALFLESDRMGWLLPALDEKVVSSEREIVLNEKRDGENQPGGLLFPALLAALYPASHPYSIPAIGREPDLRAAGVEDAKNWFRGHYGPNNAVLVLAGDIDAKTARPMVEHWFGQIPPGPTPARFASPVPERSAPTRQTLTDKVATVQLMRAWPLPGEDTPGMAALEVGLATFGSGPTSLLYDRLVRRERLAVGVSADVYGWEGASIAMIGAEVRPGVDPAQVEKRIDELLAEWKQTGPSADELNRIATRSVAGTIRALEQVGGFGGKGQTLAEGAVFSNDPADYKRQLAEIAGATPETVKAAAARWLTPNDHRVTLMPGERNPTSIDAPQAERVVTDAAKPATPGFQPQGTPADRSLGAPAAGDITKLTAPKIERATLSNGMKVQFVANHAVPVVRMQLALDGGVSADSRAKPGTQRLMLGLLREGTNGALGALDGPEIARRLERLGSSVSASAALDRTRINLNTLTPNLAPSLQLFADIVSRPAFPEDQLERIRGQVLADLANEATEPGGVAIRAAPALIYGPAHPYGQSFNGNGTPDGVKAVTRADLAAFHAALLQPADAVLFVVGDTSMAEVLPLLEQSFGKLKPAAAPLPLAKAAVPAPQAPGKVVLYDRPGAPQAFILAGAPLPLTGRDDILPLGLANDVFGGLATSRLNKLLREEKGWSYGASSSAAPTRGNMPFLLTAPVDRARAGESIAAIRGLLDEFHGKRPPEAAEVDRARASSIRSLPADFETGGAMLGALERAVVLNRPDDYLATLPARIEAVPLQAVRQSPLPAAADLVFIVVGDKATLEPQLKALGLPVELRSLP